MNTRLFYLISFLFLFSFSLGYSDFLPHDKLTFDFLSGKRDKKQEWLIKSWVPISIIDGHTTIEWLHTPSISNNLKGKIEGGYRLGHFSLRGYTEYDEIIHIGINIEHRYHKPGLHIHTGVGTWLEDWQDIEVGPRGYIHIKIKKIVTVNTDLLLSHDLKDYRIHIRPVIDIPIYTEHLALLLMGNIKYNNKDIDWYWKYGFRWRW